MTIETEARRRRGAASSAPQQQVGRAHDRTHALHQDSTGGHDDLKEQILRAQQGSAEAREGLIRAFVPFVLRVVQKVCHRPLRFGRDDEVSEAMIAFIEAIDDYQPRRGTSFPAFARMVVQHRVIDVLRRGRWRCEVPVAALAAEPVAEPIDLNVRAAELREAMRSYQAAFGAVEHREEILAYKEVLRQHGLSLIEVVMSCPRHADARGRAIAAARAVAHHDEWRGHLLERHALPLKEMVASRTLGMSRTTLERHRRYIVAVALLFCCRGALATAEDSPWDLQAAEG
ncbi:MAG TPA: sigma-70 family RNA polymerase sigma factor [Bacillota bacterium]|nr:sigma-70 family RNA polymerase sigma factor [Bacillota bacterium]